MADIDHRGTHHVLMRGVGAVGLHRGAHLRGADFPLVTRQRQNLMACGLHRAGFMAVDMAGVRAQHTLKRPERRGDHRQIGLRAARDKVHRRIWPAALFPDDCARAFAVRVLAVSGGLLPVAPHQRVQHGLRRAASIIAFKMQHIYPQPFIPVFRWNRIEYRTHPTRECQGFPDGLRHGIIGISRSSVLGSRTAHLNGRVFARRGSILHACQ